MKNILTLLLVLIPASLFAQDEFSDATSQATTIRDEVGTSANTATRVGTALLAIIDTAKNPQLPVFVGAKEYSAGQIIVEALTLYRRNTSGTSAATFAADAAQWSAIGDAGLQNNLSAVVAPTNSNDNTEGYSVGSIWIDTVTDSAYIATDVATSAAVWARVSESPLNNLAATSPPGVGDDDLDGYTISSTWIDTANDKTYIAVDVSTGAAVWVETSSQGTLNNATASNPTVNSDSSAGYGIGSTWVNTSTTPPTILIASDVSVGAAVWNVVDDSPKVNATTTDPTITDDSTAGYAVGSTWINTTPTPDAVFVATDVSTGAAVWVESNTPTNLSTSLAPGSVTINSNTGTNAIISGAAADSSPGAADGTAGVMSSADKLKTDTYVNTSISGSTLPTTATVVGQLFIRTGATNPGLYRAATTTGSWIQL